MLRKLKLEELNRPSVERFLEEDKIPLIVVLEDIRSLSNIGAIFRTADAFKIEAIYLVGITARPPHREIQKTALGATESVKWEYFEKFEDCFIQLQKEKRKILAIEQTENSTSSYDIPSLEDSSYAIVLGNEVDGVKQETINLCNGAIEIPQFGTKHSLNVSVCAGILMYEFLKKLNA